MYLIDNLKFKYQNSPVVRRVFNGAFWSLTGIALAKAFVLIASIFCARILGSSHFGELGIVRSTIGMFVVLGASGLGYTANKYIAEFRAKGQKDRISNIYNLTFSFGIFIGLVITVSVFGGAKYISEVLLKNSHLCLSIRLGAILLFMSIFNSVQNGVITGFERFKIVAINTFISSFFESLGIVVGSYFYGIEGAIVGYGLSFVIWAIINFLSIRKIFLEEHIVIVHKLLTQKDFSVIWNFSIPAMMNTIMVVPSFWLIKTMLVNYASFESLGIYEVADQWKVIVLFVPGAIANILLPIFSNIQGSGNNDSFSKTLRFSIIINGGIAFLLFLLVYVFKDFIISFYGKGYENISILVVLCFSTIFSSMAQVLTLSLISLAKVWVSFMFNLIWAILLLGSSYVMLEYGLRASALAWANVIAYSFHCLLQILYIKSIESPIKNDRDGDLR